MIFRTRFRVQTSPRNPKCSGPFSRRFLQKRGKLLRPLLLGKFWRAARPRRCLQGLLAPSPPCPLRLLAPLTGLFHPVAYRAVADAERLSDVSLPPMSVCRQPFCFSSNTRKRRASRGATSSNFSVGIVYWQNFSSVFFPPPVECQCQPPGSLL